MPGPLEGIKIVDLSVIVAGPLATMMLADQGAEVVKIETQEVGDVTRVTGFAKAGLPALFMNNNRGKRSIALDARTDEGRQIVLDLVADADVFVQNFTPGAVDRLGLGYDDLRAVTPDIIYTSISGFGPTGPYAKRPVLDPVIQGLTGIVAGQVNPEIPFPDLVRTLVADKSTAYTVAQAITAALFARAQGRGGQHLEIPMLDATMAFFWPDGMMDKTVLDDDATPGFRTCDRYRFTETADGKVIYFGASIRHVHGLLRIVGRDDLVDEPRFATMAGYRSDPAHSAELGALVEDGFAQRSTEVILAGLVEHEVPGGPILDRDEALVDEQTVHNEVLVEWEHPDAGRIRQPGPAARFSETPQTMRQTVAHLGQHTDEVLAELGRSPDQIAALRDGGIVS